MDEGKRFSGLTFGAIRRNSTPRQRDNYAARHQVESVEALIVRDGGTVVLYDEQATSGRRLSKRAVARDLLDDVRAKAIDGIAVTVLDRLTRDEIGKDAAAIAEVLIKARALLVTSDQTFRLWNKDDLLIYRIKTGLAGHEVQGITERFWNGLFQKAKEEPFFLGIPPFGYATRVDEVAGAGSGGRAKLVRVPIRDESLAPVMAALAEALDAGSCLADVAAAMNDAGHARTASTGKVRGRPARWQSCHVKAILVHPLYGGQFAFGRLSDRSSPIWEATPAGVARRLENPSLDCAHLAWFSRHRIEEWRRRYLPQPGEPVKRRRKYERPLRGLLVCTGCGRQLVASGPAGYCCPVIRTVATEPLCPAPQIISEAVALRGLHLALNAAVAERADYRERLRARMAGAGTSDPRDGELAALREGLAGMERQWYGDGAPRVVPDFAVRLMSDAQDKINALAGAIDRDRRQGALSPEDEAALERLGSDPAGAIARKPVALQAAVLRRALADVRLTGQGKGSGRTVAVAGFRNRLLRT